jgi:hypothetical protein
MAEQAPISFKLLKMESHQSLLESGKTVLLTMDLRYVSYRVP